MPLFIGFVDVVVHVQIPIVAKNKREAMKYMKSNEDWKDEKFSIIDFNDADVIPIAVKQIHHPVQTPPDWPDETYCWNGGANDVQLSDAFNSESLHDPVIEHLDDDEAEALYVRYLDEQQRLREEFSKARVE